MACGWAFVAPVQISRAYSSFETHVPTALFFLAVQLADTDLHQIIRSPQPLSDEHICFFLYQVRASVCISFV